MNNENPADIIIWTNTDNVMIIIGVGWRNIVQCVLDSIADFQPLSSSYQKGLTCLLISCISLDTTVDVNGHIVLSIATAILTEK